MAETGDGMLTRPSLQSSESPLPLASLSPVEDGRSRSLLERRKSCLSLSSTTSTRVPSEGNITRSNSVGFWSSSEVDEAPWQSVAQSALYAHVSRYAKRFRVVIPTDPSERTDEEKQVLLNAQEKIEDEECEKLFARRKAERNNKKYFGTKLGDSSRASLRGFYEIDQQLKRVAADTAPQNIPKVNHKRDWYQELSGKWHEHRTIDGRPPPDLLEGGSKLPLYLRATGYVAGVSGLPRTGKDRFGRVTKVPSASELERQAIKEMERQTIKEMERQAIKDENRLPFAEWVVKTQKLRINPRDPETWNPLTRKIQSRAKR
eukprot:TRINITY_DN31717_c0_g1_i1.p1 TRINITY_DN31717_c0_g1~~TRINITY_DN31717_c0_g1_i1.p1  ORF type:complete len:318 (+),score=21.36 TRINITY_DN31717_c0_g1_i1:94-1047(+)